MWHYALGLASIKFTLEAARNVFVVLRVQWTPGRASSDGVTDDSWYGFYFFDVKGLPAEPTFEILKSQVRFYQAGGECVHGFVCAAPALCSSCAVTVWL